MADIGDVLTELGRVLRDTRYNTGLSPREAVDRARRRWPEPRHISVAALGAYERGTREVSVRRLLELADLYGAPAPALVADAIRRATPTPPCPTCGRQ